MSSPRTLLDDAARVAAIDKRGMLETLARITEVLRRPIPRADLEIAAPPRCVFIAGMGGSATVGDIAAAVNRRAGHVPIVVVRDYELPAWADERDFLIAASYSGNTEETLSVLEDAVGKGLRGMVVTQGGQLEARGAALRWPVAKLQPDLLPREALPNMLVPAFEALAQLGAMERTDFQAVALEVAAVLEQVGPQIPFDHNPAKQLAAACLARIPVVVAAEHLRVAARRWRDQLTENSKTLSYSHDLPELNHNGVMGWTHHGRDAKLLLIFLASECLHPQNARRYAISTEWAAQHGVPSHHVTTSRGSSRLSEVLSTITWGDYVSVYLAILAGHDPSENEALDWFKDRLRRESSVVDRPK